MRRRLISMKCDYKIIDFLSTKNVVEVKNEAEYEKLKSKLLDSGFDIFEQKNIVSGKI